jgi:PhzF family phenazine biosynthesis protein
MKIGYYNVFCYSTQICKVDYIIHSNPAMICYNDKLLSNEEMIQISQANQFPMTAFLTSNIDNVFNIKYYNPSGKEEVLCGHASLGAVKFVHDNNLLNNNLDLTFILSNYKINCGKEQDLYFIDIPQEKGIFIDYDNIELSKIFQLSINDIIYSNRYTNSLVDDILIEVKSSNILRSIVVNENILKDYFKKHNNRVINVFSKGSLISGIDIEIRTFYPYLPYCEDIVCGSANVGISNLLFQKYNITDYKTMFPYRFNIDGKFGGFQMIQYIKDKYIRIYGAVKNL